MKLTDYKNEEALDLLADLIDPATEIMADSEIQKIINSKADKSKKTIKVVKHVIKEHKKSIIEILARLDGVPVKDYKCNVLTLPVKIIELLSDEELIDFFTSQELTADESSYGVAMESTTEEKR